jgi:beta-1,4-mannosyl-glycoprotein beta-1,4-N-acetylglucosaminyltransferase
MKVYKVSTYTDEAELTEIVLNELDSVVDGFIFLESSHTYQMQPRKEFPAFPFKGDKIFHRTFTEYPPEAFNMKADKIEELVTSKYIDILKEIGVQPEDILLYGDADEIPYTETVKELIPHVKTGDIYALSMVFCNYWINCLSHEHPWTHFKVFNFQTLLDIGGSPQENIRKKTTGTIIENGGWHWSWMMGRERIVKKLESYSHYELNQPQFKTQEHVDSCILNGTDLFLRGRGQIISIEETPLPNYVINNIEKYKHLIHPNYRESI